ncbi:MAG: hypothetical protein JWP88_2258 [Flaviaesturariibacter sp.]|nr:hypothetical protein [Flaviaesturariibacter sp.]
MLQRRKILIFDDELNEVSKLYIALLLNDFSVEATIDPTEIGDRIRRFQPDILIINNDVEGFDGHELCDLAKKELHKPIILLIDRHSTVSTSIDSCSADELLMKPVDVKDLHETVERLIATWQ